MKRSIFLLAAFLPAVAAAEGDIALAGKVGTLGFGAELTTRLADTVHLRFGANAYNWYADTTEDDIDYEARWRTRTVSLIGDFFPIQDSVFHISAGLFYNGNELDMTAEPDGATGTYDIGNDTYLATYVGKLKGKLTFNKTSPYIGVGWGNAFAKPRGWGFAFDVGALYQSGAKLKLESAACSADPGCAANLAIEEEDAEDDLRSYRWYPVISAGAVYRF